MKKGTIDLDSAVKDLTRKSEAGMFLPHDFMIIVECCANLEKSGLS